MATIVNDKDKLLQATTVRLLSSPNNYIYFSNAAPVFNIDTLGVASPTNYTITAQLAGQLRNAGTVTWSVVSGTIATTGQSGNNWTIAAADLTTNTAVIRASLLYLGVTYTSDLTVSKITSGAVAVFADLVSESDTVASEADGTGYTLPTGNSLRLYSGGSLITTGVTYSGTATKNGLTLTINATTGAITLSGASWTSNQESFTVTATYNTTAYTTAYSITKSRRGNDAVVLDLISDADVVFAANDGTGYTLPVGNSARLYKGGVVLTTGVTYSGTTTKNGLTLTVNASTGEIVLSGASWTSNQESFTVTATYNALSYNIIYTIAKSRTGASGVKTADALVYRWATATAPTITGTSTYTWATGAVTSAPSGWFTTVSDTGTASQILWVAKVTLTEPVTATTTSVNWATAIITPLGYFGTTGAVGRIAYAASSSTLSSTPNTVAVSGDNVPTTGSWLAGLVWSTTVPVLSAGQSVWQSEGVYNPTNNQTIWEVPYLSSLKVGNLSALSTNTGSLTVSGNVTIGSYGNIRGGQTAYNTGTGFFLGYSGTEYRFSIGNSTTNMTWASGALSVTGGVIQTGTSGARLVMGGPSYQQALMGYNTGGGLTLGVNANTGQVFASNYAGTIAGDFDNVSASFPALRGSNTSTGNGVAIEGRSTNYFGGAFYGGTTSAPLYLNPTGALPTKGAILGALCVYNNLLYFHNGTTWKQVSLI